MGIPGSLWGQWAHRRSTPHASCVRYRSAAADWKVCWALAAWVRPPSGHRGELGGDADVGAVGRGVIEPFPGQGRRSPGADIEALIDAAVRRGDAAVVAVRAGGPQVVV